MANPYKSIEDKLVLPQKYKLRDDQKIFKYLNKAPGKQQNVLRQALFQKTNALVTELNESFEVFENPNQFRFKFPQSMFPAVQPGERNNIRYEQKIITQQENTFKDRLSEEQLQDIEETGEFKVKSNIQYITLPYVWRINQALFWGNKKVKQVWNQSLANIFGLFWLAKRNLELQIPQQLKNLARYPKKFVNLLVGLKSIKTAVPVDYHRQIFKDFWAKILKDYYHESEEWCSALWSYLYVYYNPELTRPFESELRGLELEKRQNEQNAIRQKFQADQTTLWQKKNQIIEINNNFNQEWGKLKKKVIIEITAEVNEVNDSSQQNASSQAQPLLSGDESDKDQKILQKLAEKKFTLYVQHIKSELPKKEVPLDVINAIVFILRLFNLINLKNQQKQKLKTNKRQEIMQKIRNLHKIKSLFSPFFTAIVNSEMQPISKALDEELLTEILKDKEILGLLSKEQVAAVKEFINLRLNYNVLIEAKKKELPQYHSPSRVFYSNYHLLPPYKVLKSSQNYYSLKRMSDDLTVDTSTDFWKVKLYWMRFKTWTMNCLFFLVASAWKGPLGLRCLWGKEDFRTQMGIDYQTGQISYQTRSTVIGTFIHVLEGIKKSRRVFEQTPDLGLLGKNLSRYGNYFQCYIFRFLFVGLLLTLIGYPLLIVAASGLTVALVLSFWVWVPLIMAVCFVFNIFIKQFETPFIVYGFWPRSFPIIRLILGILKCLGIILFAVGNLLLIAPLKTFFLFLFCSVQNIFRRTVDSILVFLFRKVGRTPSRDTNIARKISGPGMTKEFYMSINEEDVYVLVQSKLEQIYVQTWDRLIQEKIQSNSNAFRADINSVLSPFGATYNLENQLTNNVNYLIQNYRTQYAQYCNRYPENPYNVRFTQEEIDNYFDNTVNIVRRFVDKHQISGWIFEHYQLYEGMYDQLTRSIWIDIFGCGEEIFQPLEKLDSRFKLQDQYKQGDDGFNYQMKSKVGSVMKALEGEVFLQHNHRKIAPFKHNLLNRQSSSEQISNIFSYHTQNSILNVQTDLKNVRVLFVPNLNIKEIATVDEEARKRKIKEEKFLLDL